MTAGEQHRAISDALTLEQGVLDRAQGVIGGLEARVAQGDATVSAVELLQARHEAELATRRIAQLREDSLAAREKALEADGDALIAEWAEAAPRHRAEVQAKAEALAAAVAELRTATRIHNDAVRAARSRAVSSSHPQINRAVIGMGFGQLGSETLRSVDADDLIAAVTDSTGHFDSPNLPEDVLPAALVGRRSRYNRPRSGPAPSLPRRFVPPAPGAPPRPGDGLVIPLVDPAGDYFAQRDR